MSHFTAGDEVFIRALSTGFWDLSFSSVNMVTTAPVVVNTWQHIALTWENATINFYVNGELVHTQVPGVWEALANVFAIGYYGPTPDQYWSGKIDDVVILGRASPPDEVRAVYESNAPVFAETSTFQWRAGRNRISADAEGLWGLGASGGTILGLYAGNEEDPAATKSWGGLNLSEGDLLLGQYGAAKGGWMHFDQDLVGGLPAWRFGYGNTEVIRFDSGGASLNGWLDIDTAGGIYQGTGTLGSPDTGLKIWNVGGVGKIAGYNNFTEQWYVNTDGKLYAGGGNVKLDTSGVTINAKSVLALENTPTTNSVLWASSVGTVIGGISMQYWSSANANWMVVGPVSETSGRAANMLLQTIPFGGGSGGGKIELLSNGNITVAGTIALQGTVTATSSIIASGQLGATVNHAANSPLFLANSLGPYIHLNNGISAAALGAYVGKMPINVAGTIRYIAVYA
jgi:hypothetical protein